MSAVNGSTHLLRRSGRYYFRRKVPAELVEVLGKREIKIALGTADPKAARELVRIESLKLDQEFAEARRKIGAGADRAELTRARLEVLRRSATESILGKLRADLENDPLWPHRRVETGDVDQATGEAIEESHLDSTLDLIAEPWVDVTRGHRRKETDREIAELLDRHDVPLPKDIGNLHALRRVIAGAVLEGLRQFREEAHSPESGRSAGEAIKPDTSPGAHPNAAPSALPSEPLSTVFTKWVEERRPSPKTRFEFETCLKRFKSATGDLPVGAITKQHIRAFKDHLLARQGRSGRLAPGTINKQLGALGTLLSWAIRNGYRAGENPAEGMRVTDPEPDKEKRLPFDVDDLGAIFTSPVFTRHSRPAGGCGEAAYWLPLLALYTGARLEELGQLLVTDLRQQDDVRYLDLNTIEEGKRLKTRGSKRRVPLHPEIVRLGFLEFVQAQREAGRERLFNRLKTDSKGTLTGNWSKWWGRYLRKTVGIEDRRKVFHSFRHTFKDACRRARIMTDVHNALTGHSGQTVADNYGGEYPLEMLAEAVEKIRYEGLCWDQWPARQAG